MWLHQGEDLDDFAEKVREELARTPIGPDKGCDYHPCHFEGQDCSFCYCPFYPCLDGTLGEHVISKRTGKEVWSCKECMWIHRDDVIALLSKRISELGITEPDDCRLKVLKSEVEAIIPTHGKAIMVLGATSGAGKSLMVAALCRILSNMGMRVAPFKSQNMSLNSFVTSRGEEVARAQDLQARAARVEVRYHMNPILLKPKRDDVSQIIVEGKPYRDCDVPSYYDEFVPNEGVAIVKRNLDHLLQLYDVVVMEGAGSPAEINIYDRDIANMGAARLANADCMLVVNIEWGGAFAYALGTIALLPEEDRKMVKGILINNLRGNPEGLRPGMDLLEEMTGVPVLGVVPHMDLELPTEDSMFISNDGEGNLRVGIVRLPRISNFTDFDALSLEEGVMVLYIDSSEEVGEVDAIIIPGTKNTIEDLKWMRERGIDRAIVDRAGEVPILGICGGYQMLGSRITDLQGLEGDEGAEVDGLGLLDMSTSFDRYEKRTVQVEGEFLLGGKVRGYEIHMGTTEAKRLAPLFKLTDQDGEHLEGGWDECSKVFGTYLHGVFDLPSFRRYFLDLIEPMERSGEGRDYDSVIEENLDLLAETVAEAMDMDRFLPRFDLEGK